MQYFGYFGEPCKHVYTAYWGPVVITLHSWRGRSSPVKLLKVDFCCIRCFKASAASVGGREVNLSSQDPVIAKIVFAVVAFILSSPLQLHHFPMMSFSKLYVTLIFKGQVKILEFERKKF